MREIMDEIELEQRELHREDARRTFWQVATAICVSALIAVMLFVIPAHAASPKPIPAPKQTVTFIQGATSRTLNSTAPTACIGIYGDIIRGFVGYCGSGSYVQFPKSGGNVSVHWSMQDTCGPKPADVRSHANCPAGTKGNGWDQTATYTQAAPPQCWALGAPQPATPPEGACIADTPPPVGGALSIDFSFVDRSSAAYTAFINFANRTDEADPQTLAWAYKITGNASYCARAVPQVDAWMHDPGDIAGDSYLQIDQYLAPMSMVYAWCPQVTAAQKTLWANVANQTLDALWAQGCAGWGVCDLFNNYHDHFVRASVYWGIASGDANRRAFGLAKFNDQTAAVNAVIPNGGSLEGTGYQYSKKWLNDAALVIRDSGYGDAFNANGYLSANTLEWVHATTPDMAHFAPIGSQPRDSAGSIYDYQAGSVKEGCYQTTNAAVRNAAGYWSSKIPLDWYRANSWDNLWRCTPVSTPPALVYNAKGIGVFGRTAWSDSAKYLVTVAYDRSQSHAHSEFGEVMYWLNGGWGVVAGQSLSHSGINGEPPDWSTRAKNVVGIFNGSAAVRPTQGFPVVSTYTENQATGDYTICLDSTANYPGSVNLLKRCIEFAAGVATVTDYVQLAPNAGAARQQWIVPGNSAPVCSGQVCTAGSLKITVASPNPMRATIVPLSSFDSDFDRGGYRISVDCNGGCSARLSP